MSVNIDPESRSNPVFGSHATSSNTGWRLSLVALLFFIAAELSFAEQLGAELLSTMIATTSMTEDTEASIDEIVVIGIRNEDGTVRPRRLLNDPLLQHILHDFEMRQELEKEFEWRMESAYPEEDSPTVRIGYDLREETREPARKQSLELPMELIRPAIVISVDF